MAPQQVVQFQNSQLMIAKRVLVEKQSQKGRAVLVEPMG